MTDRGSGDVRHGIARVISKSGLCSRTEATRRVLAGRVTFDKRIIRDPEFPVFSRDLGKVTVDGVALGSAERIYIALNKPRGLVTTASDEKGRQTVYSCFEGAGLPWIAPVGRLDQASEGLLLFTNDPEWAARITGPESHLDKTYHVQVRGSVTKEQCRQMEEGVAVGDETWAVKSASILRSAEKTTWLTIVLDEGKNRQIRRVLESLNFGVLRLVRTAIGDLSLGELGKGNFRQLSEFEVRTLA